MGHYNTAHDNTTTGAPHSWLQQELLSVLVSKASNVARLEPCGDEPRQAQPAYPPNAIAAVAGKVGQQQHSGSTQAEATRQ